MRKPKLYHTQKLADLSESRGLNMRDRGRKMGFRMVGRPFFPLNAVFPFSKASRFFLLFNWKQIYCPKRNEIKSQNRSVSQSNAVHSFKAY